MQAVLSRAQTVGGSDTNSPHRVPRRTSSFLSLRRDKDRSPRSDSDAIFDSPELSKHSRPSFPDAHSRMKSLSSAHSSKSKSRSPSYAKSPSPPPKDHYKDICSSSYPFPTPNTSQDISTPILSQQLRTRSRTSPSDQSNWEETSSIPQLRFSGSSTQHTETPPQTPVDPIFSKDCFPVVVAAPVAGVETMDALVDGMNGGEEILSNTPGISNRARFGIPGHHPLYQPPLPTPPPGVVLGGGKARRTKRNITINHSSDSDDNDRHNNVSPSRPRARRPRPTSPRASSCGHTTPPTPSTPEPSVTRNVMTNMPGISRPGTTESLKTIVPSISDIIRAHAPPEGQVRSRPPTSRSSSHYARSQDHSTAHEETAGPAPSLLEEETDLLSRSSIDSVADEVQRTLRTQHLAQSRPPTAPPSSFMKRHSTISDNASIYSPRSDPGAMSIYSTSSNPYPAPLLDDTSCVSLIKPSSTSQQVAKYLRSSRLTTLLQLTRSPHASVDNPLTVSLSDLGSPTGRPVIVFLGLGCVRHIMGLYDEMAEILGLRLITVDRWGLGRTEARLKSTKGIMQWAAVVEEVLDLLHIGTCSIMAHSAGAPYALSFANMVPERIRGDICLLAPWVGGSESSGYKWLKYVPNGLLKTAQAAEWKIQAWMIGKPPTIPYEGIGYSAAPTTKSTSLQHGAPSPRLDSKFDTHSSSLRENRPRPSLASSTFSDYDDLRDFDGRFESRSTLGVGGARPPFPDGNNQPVTKRKPSRGFLGRLKGSGNPSPPPVPDDRAPSGGRRLKALRSMGSLKSRSASTSKKSDSVSPQLPPSLNIEVGLGFSEIDWPRTQSEASLMERDSTAPTAQGPYMRSNGHRSVSFTSPKVTMSMPSSPAMSSASMIDTGTGSGYQAALGNALIAASHAESAKGTHSDLLRILNHENHPWGFSYTSYPHRVKVWYGDKDEKIAENAVQWMAKNMGEDKCSVKVVHGADHGLMYRSSVVVEVLEHVLSFWNSEK